MGSVIPPGCICEKILTMRMSNTPIVEYLTKLKDHSYSKSIWIPESELFSRPESSILLSTFAHDIPTPPTTPPFYNPNYDIIDHIINRRGNSFLVLWKDLDYEQLTIEDNISAEDLVKFEGREAASFSDLSSDISSPPRFRSYSLDEIPLNPIELNCLDYFLFSFIHGNDVKFSDDCGMKQLSIFTAFFHFLYKNGEFGPFLVVAEDPMRWFDQFRSLEEMTVLLYTGSLQNRQRIRELEFVKFHILITTPAVVESDQRILSPIHFRVLFGCRDEAEQEECELRLGNYGKFL